MILNKTLQRRDPSGLHLNAIGKAESFNGAPARVTGRSTEPQVIWDLDVNSQYTF